MIGQPFHTLASTDSTNNYAMGLVQQGLAHHGCAVFARNQTAGKGQRGRVWVSEADQNIALSVVLKPSCTLDQQFLLSMFAAVAVAEWLSTLVGDETRIKWPNDLYWRDRKAGGILIENLIQGRSWTFAILGIGININQVTFPEGAGRPVSVRQITGKTFDPLEQAYRLCDQLQHRETWLRVGQESTLVEAYNALLYKKGEEVSLQTQAGILQTRIQKVDEKGLLHTQDTVARQFVHGSVEWQTPSPGSFL
jgi:BirA family biotin operon repressor/biotin-[acetyl-CoA-carboxylase] ligase